MWVSINPDYSLVQKADFVGTNTFYIIVFSGVFVIALISVLVWALVRIKKQNDLIVAKVEKFKEEESSLP